MSKRELNRSLLLSRLTPYRWVNEAVEHRGKSEWFQSINKLKVNATLQVMVKSVNR